MFNIGMGELVIIFLAVFMLFGPESLPKIAHEIGAMIARIKKGLDELKSEV